MRKVKLFAVLSATVLSVIVLSSAGGKVNAAEIETDGTEATADAEVDEVIANDETGIPDENFYAEILRGYDSNDNGKLEVSEATRVTSIMINDDCGIKSLQGIRYLTNLTYVTVTNNQISDIDDFSSLTELTDLNLSGNQISNIDALSGLTNLKNLYLTSNQISDVKALSNLTALHSLCLVDNQISDISVLSKLTGLVYLDLEYNQISDISVLSNFTKLQTLNLGNNKISDISVLSNSKQVDFLNLENNKISKLPNLPWNNYVYLNFNNNKITDLSGLKNYSFQIKDQQGNYTGWAESFGLAYEGSGAGIYYLGEIYPNWAIAKGNPDITKEHLIAVLPSSMLNASIVDENGNAVMTWLEAEGFTQTSVVEDTKVSSEEFVSIVEMNKTEDVVIKSNDDDVLFVFKKGTMNMVDGIESYDFSVTLTKEYTEIADLPTEITNDNFIAKIDYSYSGMLPGTASIQIFVGKNYVGQKLYYSQIMDDSTIVPLQSMIVDEEGYVTITQDHCSSYIITKEAVGAEVTTTEATTEATTTATETTPATGDSSMPWVYGALAVSALAALIALKRKATI